jgi:cytochrome c peroxidase
MSDEQKRGAIVLLTSGKCVECHTGPALSSNTFYAFGLGDFDDAPNAVIQSMVDMDKTARGRGGFTNNPDDNYKFKTPTLYNLGHGNPLGHGGTIATVEDMIRYKVAGNKENTMVPDGQLAEEFGAISLSEQEILDLTAFVGIALQDPELLRYVPESLPSGACFPNSDVQSKNDMGCE